MSPQDLATKIESLVITANGKYSKSILSVQDKIYSQLVPILKGLELDSDGFIKQSAFNRKILAEAQAEFDLLVNDALYQSSLEKYLKNIPNIDSLNAAYFETVSSAFKPNRIFIKQLQTQTIESINTLALQDGFVANVSIPLNEILNQNVNAGGSFSGMLEQLRTYIKGTADLDGRLLSYSKGILRDTLFNYARAYQQSVVSDLGLKWYLYAGGLIDKSRDFCIERAGKYFKEEEIKSWAGLNWQGKNKYTTESSIFIYAGGHSCSHQLIAVHDSAVPDEFK